MQQGDHLVSTRIGYAHHGLYIGHGQVIHYTGSVFDLSQSGIIAKTSIDDFCQGKGYTIQTHLFRRYPREESTQRAYSRLGEMGYNLLLNNCEHFVTWCIQGVHASAQVNKAIEGVVVGQRLLTSSARKPIEHTLADFAVKGMEQDQAMKPFTQGPVASISNTIASKPTSVVGLVSSRLIASTLASITTPLVAGTFIGYEAIKLLTSLFDE